MESKKQNAGKLIVILVTAIIKSQLKRFVGEGTVQELGKELTEYSSEEFNKLLDTWFTHKAEEIDKVVQRANECFLKRNTNSKLAEWAVMLPVYTNESLQTAIANLPNALDTAEIEMELKATIGRDWKSLSEVEINQSVEDYFLCLKRALSSVDDFKPDVVAKEVLQIGITVNQINTRVKHIEEMLQTQERPDTTLEQHAIYNFTEPPLLPTAYIDRKSLIEELKSIIRQFSYKREPKVLGITGLGGVGKTILAKSFLIMDICREIFKDGYYWMSLSSGESSNDILDYHLSIWLKNLGVDPSITSDLQSKLRELNHLLHNKKMICIIDDVYEVDNLSELINSLGNSLVIVVISRDKEVLSRLPISRILNVGNLNEEEARLLIEKRIGINIQDEDWQNLVRPILSNIGFHTLAIYLLASQISMGDINWYEIFEMIATKSSLETLDYANPVAKGESIQQTIDLSVNMLGEEQKKRLFWLGVMAKGVGFLAEDAAMLWSASFDFYADDLPSEEETSFDRQKKFRDKSKDILRILHRRGLVEIIGKYENEPIYRLHEILHDYCIFKLHLINEFNQALVQHAWVYTSIVLTSSTLDLVFSFQVIFLQVISIIERSWKTIENQKGIIYDSLYFARFTYVKLTMALGNYWYTVGYFPDYVRSWIQRSFIVSEDLDDAGIRREILSLLASISMYDEEHAKALEYQLEALRISRELDDKVHITSTLSDCGMVYLNLQDFEKADQFLNEALEIVGDDENMKGRILSYLGLLNSRTGKFNDAIMLLEESVQLAESNSDISALTKRLGDLGAAYANFGIDLLHRAVMPLSVGRQIAHNTNRLRELAKQSYTLGIVFYHLNQYTISTQFLKEAKDIFEVLHNPMTKSIDDLIQQIEKKQESPYTPLASDLILTIFALADNAAMGDNISKDIVLPILRQISDAKDEEVRNMGKNLQKYIHGEKDSEILIDGLSPEYQIIVILSTIRLEDLGKAFYIKKILSLVSRFIDGEEGVKNQILEIITDIEFRIASGVKELQGIDKYLSLIIVGERDSKISTSFINNKRYRTLFSIFTTMLFQKGE
jgi:tetratricopeptide (TPR) repeat protein